MEEWRPIVHPKLSVGRFEISNTGRVRSNPWRVRNRYSSHVVPSHEYSIQRGEYDTVCLESITLYVHKLLAQAFIPNPDNKPCVNHIDGDKHNNSLANLEWCTHSENDQHKQATGLANQNGLSLLCVEDKLTFHSIAEAARYYQVSQFKIRKRIYDEPQSLPYQNGEFNKHFVYTDEVSDPAVRSIDDLRALGYVQADGESFYKSKQDKSRTPQNRRPAIPCYCPELDKHFSSIAEAAVFFHRGFGDVQICVRDPARKTVNGYHILKEGEQLPEDPYKDEEWFDIETHPMMQVSRNGLIRRKSYTSNWAVGRSQYVPAKIYPFSEEVNILYIYQKEYYRLKGDIQDIQEQWIH